MSPTETARTFAEAIAQLDDEQLTTLLTARPDLATPAPEDLGELATRAAADPSVHRALDHLDQFTRTVVEAFAALPDGVADTEVVTLTGAGAGAVGAAVDRLRERALLWGADHSLHLLRGARQAFGRWPGGLANPSAQPQPTDAIDRVVEALDDPERGVLNRLLWGPPTGTVRNATRGVTAASARTPVEKLLAAGLLRPLDDDTVVLPREVALRVRGGFTAEPVSETLPDRPGTGRSGRLVDNAAVGAAHEFSHLVEVLIDRVEARPPKVLRTGTIAARDVTSLGRAAGLSEEQVRFALGLAEQAGLLSLRQEVALPTSGYDRWTALDPAPRWEALHTVWLATGGWHGTSDDDFTSRVLPVVRHLLHPHHQTLTVEGLLGQVRWLRPGWARREDLATAVERLLTEATWLGVLALDCPTVLTDGAAPGSAAADLFPEPIEQIIVQADLTAVAPGPLGHGLRRTIKLLADQESHGGGGVFRFTARSLRRAFDAGWDAAAIEVWLRENSSTPVPQPLLYLIADVARQHGAVRIGAARCFLRFDDPSQATLATGHARADELGLLEVAPGVLIGNVDADEVVDFLRSIGLAPTAADGSGQLQLSPKPTRAPTRPPTIPSAPASETEKVVERLRIRAEQARDRTRQTASTIDALEQALTDQHRIEVAYVTNSGTRSQTTAVPVALAAGMVRLAGPGAAISVPLARIISVRDSPVN